MQDIYPAKKRGTTSDISKVVNSKNGTATETMNLEEILAVNAKKKSQEFAAVEQSIRKTNANYSGKLYSKDNASDRVVATNGVITTDNKAYTVGNETIGNTISESDYLYLVGQVAGESANSTDDMLGVTSTVLNRIEKYDQGVKQVLEEGYWPWGKSCDKFLNYDSNGNPVSFKTIEELGPEEYKKLEIVKKVVADGMNGIRNVDSDTIYYFGDGEHNYFSDRA